MKRISYVLISLFLIPVFSYAEINKNVESLISKGQEVEQEAQGYQLRKNYNKALQNAIPYYEQAINLVPSEPDANLLLARILIELERYQQAIANLEPYLTLSPKDIYAQYYLGKCYYETGNYERAEEILKNGIKLFQEDKKQNKSQYHYYRWSYWDEQYPEIPFALHHFLGKSLKGLKKYDEALNYYQEIISRMPLEKISNPEGIFYLELGEIYWLKGNEGKAKELLNQLRSIDRFKYWADKLEAVIKNKK